MKYIKTTLSLALLVAIVGCSSNATKSNQQKKSSNNNETRVSYVYQNDAQTKSLRKKGAIIVKLAATSLGKALNKSVKEDGAENAIDFCNHNAMSITDSLASAEGVTIRRLAKKNRNPKNETNAVESKIFKQYIMEWLGGKTLDAKITIDKNGHPVYYKPIIINKKCLTCHGKPGKSMPTNIAAKIKKIYPDDRAIDFEDGHPRGMWAITFNNITVKNN